MMISGFIGLGYGPFMKAATYQMDEGVKQGDMEAMPNFCIGINQANKSTHDSLQEKGGVILSGADDTYILGPPQIAFPEVKLHEERLASIGLKLNYSKMKCYIKESKKSEIYHELREAANIPEGFIEGEDGTTLFGLRAYGVPIGSEIFVTEWLKTKGERIRSNLLEIGNLLDPNRIASRDIPSRQCLWLLTLNCLQFKGNYFVRNIPPQFTEELCTTLDSAIDKLMGQCFSLKSEELSTFNKTRIYLPIRLGGLGVRELSHVRHAEFIGGVMDGIPPLLP